MSEDNNALDYLIELKEDQDKICKILIENGQTWDYAPSDGVLSLINRLKDEIEVLSDALDAEYGIDRRKS